VQYAGTDLATVVDTVGQPLWVIDPNGRVRLVNAAAVAALGYDDASELYGAPSHETIHYKHPDGSPFPAAECPHLAARVTGRPFRSELDWFVRRDGSMLPVAVVCTPLELPDGTGVVMAFTDIEERRRHEAELLERDQILAAVIQPVWVATHEGLLHYCNPAAVRVLGYDSADELLGLPAHAKVHYKRRDGSPYPVEECPVTAARLRGETIEVVEDHWIRKDGSFVLVSYSAAPIELAGGTGAVVAFTDVDERRRAEQAMRERDVAEARAAELAAARRRIIEAHDAARRRVTRDLHDGAQQQLVNTVINLQLARRRLDEDPERARELMDEALERAQAGIVELRELAAGIHPAMLVNRGLGPAVGALADGLPLPVDVNDGLEERVPDEIEASLYFFVSEALTNVVKHAEATSARVRLAERYGALVVEVADDGIGGVTPDRPGTGLRGLGDRVAALDGTFAIESVPGAGTTLRAQVPLSR
jgi:PAS domain S-box-containing protein